jgi:hypothetical protein
VSADSRDEGRRFSFASNIEEYWKLEEQLIGELCLPLNLNQDDGHPRHTVVTEARRRVRARAREPPAFPCR